MPTYRSSVAIAVLLALPVGMLQAQQQPASSANRENSASADSTPATRPATLPSAPPYPTSHDKPLEPTEKVVATTDSYVLWRIEFSGIREGSRVPANFYVPKNPRFKAPFPAVMLQYGSGGNKNSNYIKAIGELAVSRGLAVITIDVPNRGERKGKDPRLGFLDANFFQCLGDYSRAADYLCSRRDIDAKRISYIGISWGAITGLTFCAHDPRIAVVVSLVGGGNFISLVPGEVSDEVRKRAQTYDPYYHIGLIAPRPLMLVNCTRDQIMPRIMADSIQKAAPESAKKIWMDSDHIFNGTDRVKLCNSVIDFIYESFSAPRGGRAVNAPATRHHATD